MATNQNEIFIFNESEKIEIYWCGKILPSELVCATAIVQAHLISLSVVNFFFISRLVHIFFWCVCVECFDDVAVAVARSLAGLFVYFSLVRNCQHARLNFRAKFSKHFDCLASILQFDIDVHARTHALTRPNTRRHSQ